jgi:hypothetical protein
MAECSPGDQVHTPFGKGVVREVRSGARYAVDVRGRLVVFAARDVAPLEAPRGRRGRTTPVAPPPTIGGGPDVAPTGPVQDVDLHGLSVADALARADAALNEALLAQAGELRLIHGRTGGRIRAALHARLRHMPGVRSFALDPRNAGVTVVLL